MERWQTLITAIMQWLVGRLPSDFILVALRQSAPAEMGQAMA